MFFARIIALFCIFSLCTSNHGMEQKEKLFGKIKHKDKQDQPMFFLADGKIQTRDFSKAKKQFEIKNGHLINNENPFHPSFQDSLLKAQLQSSHQDVQENLNDYRLGHSILISKNQTNTSKLSPFIIREKMDKLRENSHFHSQQSLQSQLDDKQKSLSMLEDLNSKIKEYKQAQNYAHKSNYAALSKEQLEAIKFELSQKIGKEDDAIAIYLDELDRYLKSEFKGKYQLYSGWNEAVYSSVKACVSGDSVDCSKLHNFLYHWKLTWKEIPTIITISKKILKAEENKKNFQQQLNVANQCLRELEQQEKEIIMQNNLIANAPLEQATTALQDFTIPELSLDEKAFAEKHGLLKNLKRPVTQAEQRIIERESAILKELLAAQEEGKIDENQFATELSRRWTEVAVESIKESCAHLENEIISYLKKAGGFWSSEKLDAAAEMIKKSENYLELKKNLDSMLFSRKAMRDIYIGVPLDLAEDTIVFFTRLKRDPKGLVKDIANGVYKTGSLLGQHLGELLDEAECLDIESGSYNPTRAAALCEKHANELGLIIDAVKKDPSGYARKFIVTYIKWRVLDAVLQKGFRIASNALKERPIKVSTAATGVEGVKITQIINKLERGLTLTENEVRDLIRMSPEHAKNLEQLEQIVDKLGKITQDIKIKWVQKPNMGYNEILNLEEEAAKTYNSLRSSSIDLAKISEKTEISINILERIKNHMFYEKHLLGERIARFDPSIDLARAWQRLIEGNFCSSDLRLLLHEYIESVIMERYLALTGNKLEYATAHKIANSIYNWQNTIE